ncbi:hypothetical protein MS3_00011074 [Schistosoma haematobium]|uniref:Uncharacterized protein n=1 Tax=Schistosoma haematobium TaxID=6185 RepID=A0A922LFS6_SCHHA|nr:hypothetical protein MS3_00011074 [Schistosoma haematobium]KAH9581786.1 hypothetical protein MS3_00011074 [Schistosoma haematobium]
MDTSTNEMINILKYDHLLIISTYTRTVLILVAVLIGVMLLVIVISWQLTLLMTTFATYYSIFVDILLVIASAIALLIAFVKKIYEKYPLNVGLAIIYSICVATAIGLWNLDVAITIQLVACVLDLTIFTSALLIGALIETSLMDSFKVLLIILSVISAIIISAMVIVYLFQQNMTIFYSHFTVGKSRYRLFYPNYTLAALLLYIMFSTALPITDDLVYTMRNNWNVTNSTGFSLYNDTTL